MDKAKERSKEIMQAALDYANNLDDVKPTDDFSRKLCIALGQAFIKGAEWADKTMLDKACIWIMDNFPTSSRMSATMYANDFRKAMEE